MRQYSCIAFVVLFLLSLSQATADGLRGRLAAVLGPSWNWLNTLAITSQPLGNRALKQALAKDNRRVITAKDEIQRLELENRQLRLRLSELQALVTDPQANTLVSRADKVAARVIYRSPATWNSVFWLNVGESDNDGFGRKVVAKNSPVVMGASLVGVIDLVNAHQSRVRLITDSNLVPAVRVLREGKLLAKGELHGSVLPLWRREGRVLHGVGFNYDFADEEGPALDLRSGKPMGMTEGEELTIIEVGDTLITSGLDGMFPPGLRVGEVTYLQPLREGDYFYEIEAKPAFGDPDALSLLYVLPAIGFDH